MTAVLLMRGRNGTSWPGGAKPIPTTPRSSCTSWQACRCRRSRDMDTTPEHVEQPMPVPNDQPSIQSLVRADLELREQVGIARYGTSLQPFNGRDAVRDAYEEAMDLTLYLRQVMEERDQRHLPQHGSDVEEWIRRARNRHEAESPEWNAL